MMPYKDDANIDLAQIVDLSGQDAVRVRHLLLCDASFRSMCEDHALARRARNRLAGQSGSADQQKTFAEYDALIAELEHEIMEAARNAR